jgi:3-oxoacyl-[acyl-carrier-protein] synthase-3
MTASRIVALGHYQPDEILTNADLERMVETNDEWIRSRVGIEERHIARHESVADLATQAAAKALAASGRSAADIDLVVVASEKMSDMTDWTDRSTCVLTGDGAGAAVIEACDDG